MSALIEAIEKSVAYKSVQTLSYLKLHHTLEGTGSAGSWGCGGGGRRYEIDDPDCDVKTRIASLLTICRRDSKSSDDDFIQILELGLLGDLLFQVGEDSFIESTKAYLGLTYEEDDFTIKATLKSFLQEELIDLFNDPLAGYQLFFGRFQSKIVDYLWEQRRDREADPEKRAELAVMVGQHIIGFACHVKVTTSNNAFQGAEDELNRGVIRIDWNDALKDDPEESGCYDPPIDVLLHRIIERPILLVENPDYKGRDYREKNARAYFVSLKEQFKDHSSETSSDPKERLRAVYFAKKTFAFFRNSLEKYRFRYPEMSFRVETDEGVYAVKGRKSLFTGKDGHSVETPDIFYQILKKPGARLIVLDEDERQGKFSDAPKYAMDVKTHPLYQYRFRDGYTKAHEGEFPRSRGSFMKDHILPEDVDGEETKKRIEQEIFDIVAVMDEAAATIIAQRNRDFKTPFSETRAARRRFSRRLCWGLGADVHCEPVEI